MDLKSLFGVEGKTVVVTGGSRGIGLMIARGFVDNGADVIISSRKADVCAQVAKELGCSAIPADLSQASECERLASTIAAEHEKVHVLVNNAGAVWGAPLAEFPDSAFDKILAVNVKAVFNLTRLLLPQLKAASMPEDPARVIMIGSIDGIRVPSFENYSYSASKAAVHMLTRHLAHALVRDGINVNAIAPGLFPSNMTKFMFEDGVAGDAIESFVPMGREGRPEDMAGTALFLSSRAGAYLTGAVIPVDGGVSTHG